MKEFKDVEIKAGYLLVVKTDDKLHNMSVIPNKFGGLGVATPGREGQRERWWNLGSFNEKGVYLNSEVIAVYGHTANKFLLDNSTEARELLWGREMAAVNMTLEEIEEKLGHPVCIVKEKSN